MDFTQLRQLSSETLGVLKEAIQRELDSRLARGLMPGVQVKFKDSRGATVVLKVKRVNKETVSGEEVTSLPGAKPRLFKVSKSLLVPLEERRPVVKVPVSENSTGFRPVSENPNAW